MRIRSVLCAALAGLVSMAVLPQARAATIFADTVIEYFDSGAGTLAGPYGGTLASFPVSVPLTHATDGNAGTFVSLPTGSFLTLGFSGGFVFDGPGLDVFVSEVGGANETADVFVSSDFGASFTFLGTATTATVSGFDLASIGYTGQVNAVKVVGLDSFGGSPGFDLAFVQGLEGSAVITPQPATIALLGLGLLVAGARMRHRAA